MKHQNPLLKYTHVLKTFFQNAKFVKLLLIISILVNICLYWYAYIILNISGAFHDFNKTFLSALQTFLLDPKNLYFSSMTPPSIFEPRMPFQALPVLVFFFLPFYYLPSTNNFNGFSYSFYLIIFNLFACYLIHEISKKDTFKSEQESAYFKNSLIMLSIYLLSTDFIGSYQVGQTNVIGGFFVLLGIYFFYQKKEHLTYMMWSIASFFKIFVIIIIAFFIFQGSIKKFVKNACFVLIPQIPNFILFILWPNWINDWHNLYTYYLLEWGNLYFFTGSIARELSTRLSIPIIPLAVFLGCMLFSLNLWIAYKNKKMSFLDRFMLGFITIILCIPDFTPDHSILILGAYVLWMSTKSSIMTKKIKVLMGLATVFPIIFVLTYSLSIFYVSCLIFIYSNILKSQHEDTILWHRFNLIVGISIICEIILTDMLVLLGIPNGIIGILYLILLLELAISIATIFMYQKLFVEKRILKESINNPH